MKLFKTTITILSEYNPAGVGLETLTRDADVGNAYCYGQETVEIDSDTLEGEGVKEFFGCLPDEIEVPDVYASADVIGNWGFVGCDSDCYFSENEAKQAAYESVYGK